MSMKRETNDINGMNEKAKMSKETNNTHAEYTVDSYDSVRKRYSVIQLII